MTSSGMRHEWDRLREVIVGVAPADEIVLFHEEAQRWLTPSAAAVSQTHAGRHLIEVDAERARRIETQIEELAALLQREGIAVHRPERLQGLERHFLAPNGEGTQLFPRDPLIVVDDHVIEASLRLQCRQRERFGLRPHAQRLSASGARWSSVPLGWPNGIDGPILEGGDVLLNGHEIYVGMSGCATDMAGVDWLQALLGDSHRVVPVALRSNVLHLDWVLALLQPGLLVYCPEKMIDGLPMSLRTWDKIALHPDEAERLQANLLVLEKGRAVVDVASTRLIEELRLRKVEAIPLPFDGPISFGGGLRSAHLALRREG
jgi:N-dimethylarginine dimethylaminohydrolase